MSATVKETNSGRRRTGRSSERTYYITDVSSEDEALAALLSSGDVPATIDGFPRNDSDCGAEELEEGSYLGTAVYRSTDFVQQPDSFSVSFDIAGQTTHITQSLRTVNKYAADGVTPKDFRGAINVQQDGSVDGTDITTGTLAYTVNFTFEDASITTGFVNTLALIVGTVNDDDFHGYEAGELLLTSVSGQKRNDSSGNWDLKFVFAVSRNCTDGELPNGEDFVIGPDGDDQITVSEKRGWDYLWVRYEEKPVGTGADSAVHKVPVSAYVEQVYLYTDYDLLGI